MLIFARHGETVAGVEGRFEGFSDSPLTEKGKKQAELLGEYLKNKKSLKILVSPRGRAVATARIVAGILGIDFQIDERLIEVCYGSWETKKINTLKDFPLWKQREEDFFRFRHPGFYHTFPGESYEDLYQRLLPVFSELENLNQAVILIAHSGVLRCARRFFEKIDDDTFKKSKFPNSVFFSIEKENGEYVASLFDIAENRMLYNKKVKR